MISSQKKIRERSAFISFGSSLCLQKLDSELLQVNKLTELMSTVEHLQLSFLLAGFAEQNAENLEDKMAIATVLLKLTNKYASAELKDVYSLSSWRKA